MSLATLRARLAGHSNPDTGNAITETPQSSTGRAEHAPKSACEPPMIFEKSNQRPSVGALVGGSVNGSSDPVAFLQRVLGPGAVLIPVPKGEKSPKLRGWQKITLDAMFKPRYLDTLRAGNIAVLFEAMGPWNVK